MAADQERADRIRALKLDRPDLTWRRIADHVGVSERAAADWQRKGGIEYDNAKKLAALFEVDVDYIWRGPQENERAPSPFAGQDALADRLDAIDQAIQDARDEREEQARKVTDLIQKQNTLLARQSKILERIESAIDRENEAVRRDEESTSRLEEAVRHAILALPAGSGDQREADQAPTQTDTARAST